MRIGTLIAIDGVPIRKAEETPRTAGEVSADTAHQQADREMLARQRALEREYETLYSIFFAYGTSRARQLEVSARLDEIEAELASHRENLAGKTQRVAKSDPFGIGHRRQRDALGTLLRQPSLKKSEADAYDLDNSIGVRSQPTVK